MIAGRTPSGFDFEVDEKKLNDWEMVEAIADSQSEEDTDRLRATVRIARLLLGEQYKKLKTHCRQPDSSIPPDKIGEELQAIFKAIADAKAGKN